VPVSLLGFRLRLASISQFAGHTSFFPLGSFRRLLPFENGSGES
jgi:hypothetical protein